MSPLRDDYLLRMIEQAFQVLRRIMRRQSEQELPAARRDLDGALAELLGPSAELLQRLDPATAVPLLADPTRAAVWARLLAERAALMHEQGDPRAPDAALRALQVALEARELAREHPLAAEVRQALDEAREMARQRTPLDRLPERYHGLLRADHHT